MISAATSFNASGDLTASDLSAGTTVTTGGFLVVYHTLTAGGNIDVGSFLQATTINAPSSVLTVQGEITPNLLNAGAALQHTFNVDSIVSPNGIVFDGNQFNGTNGLSSGGLLTINSNTVTFDSATGIGFANFNGADAGSFSNGGPSSGGDGGTFIVNTAGDITANNGSDITATTGNNASGDNGFSGAGGTVKLVSTGGSVTVDDTIQVSSDDPIPEQTPPPPIRRSASGGTILLQSNLTIGQGITIGANGQLLSLLDTNAPGPGGSITLSTMGADITVNGTIEADRGTITIDGNGTITFNNASAHADVLQVGALGTNGVLNIGGGTLSADTTLKLYAPGGNGQLNFVSNVTLGGAGAKILAANSVTIFNNVVVTIGGSTAADVYTNIANYSRQFGGNGSTSGTFAGAGANSPQPLASAPPFDSLPGAPSSNHPPSTPGARPPGRVIQIDSSTQLLTLLDS
ncbi:MAG: beta strand repeat-containing protein, partial [Chthoniobacterales bacterium]